MTATEKSGTNEATNGQPNGTAPTDSDYEDLHRLAVNIENATAKARDRLGLLARNMDEAFDGELTYIEANAYAALTYVLGVLTDIDEEAASLKGRADTMERRHAS